MDQLPDKCGELQSLCDQLLAEIAAASHEADKAKASVDETTALWEDQDVACSNQSKEIANMHTRLQDMEKILSDQQEVLQSNLARDEDVALTIAAMQEELSRIEASSEYSSGSITAQTMRLDNQNAAIEDSVQQLCEAIRSALGSEISVLGSVDTATKITAALELANADSLLSYQLPQMLRNSASDSYRESLSSFMQRKAQNHVL
jgi:chromosome segregation ATPase